MPKHYFTYMKIGRIRIFSRTLPVVLLLLAAAFPLIAGADTHRQGGDPVAVGTPDLESGTPRQDDLPAVEVPPVLISDTQRKDTYPRLFHFGVLNLLDQVNHKDAQVAIEMNFVRRNRKQFPGISANLRIIADVATAADMFRQKRLHGIALSGIDYLILKEQVPLEPLFISTRQDKPLEAYLLLASKDVTSIKQLAALPQRRLTIENFGETHIGRMWLDTVLWEKRHVRTGAFFTAIRPADKPARMVLPVFFGQAEACLVPESAYETMVELNPQIGQRLGVLLRSPEFIRSVNCAIDDLHPGLVAALKKNAVEMPDTADGQQLMMIFQNKHHYLFEQKYIRATEEIYRRHKRQSAGGQ